MGQSTDTTHLTTELVAANPPPRPPKGGGGGAPAGGIRFPPGPLDPATEILDALYQLDARLALRDLDGIIPELRWDARWSDEGAAQ